MATRRVIDPDRKARQRAFLTSVAVVHGQILSLPDACAGLIQEIESIYGGHHGAQDMLRDLRQAISEITGAIDELERAEEAGRRIDVTVEIEVPDAPEVPSRW